MTNWARVERHRLADLLDQVGPDAPTLCGDWRTRDLAAHLILRDRRPDAVPGVVLKLARLRRHTESVQRQLADPARDWATTVDTIRQGPPRWSPMWRCPTCRTSIAPLCRAGGRSTVGPSRKARATQLFFLPGSGALRGFLNWFLAKDFWSGALVSWCQPFGTNSAQLPSGSSTIPMLSPGRASRGEMTTLWPASAAAVRVY